MRIIFYTLSFSVFFTVPGMAQPTHCQLKLHIDKVVGIQESVIPIHTDAVYLDHDGKHMEPPGKPAYLAELETTAIESAAANPNQFRGIMVPPLDEDERKKIQQAWEQACNRVKAQKIKILYQFDKNDMMPAPPPASITQQKVYHPVPKIDNITVGKFIDSACEIPEVANAPLKCGDF